MIINCRKCGQRYRADEAKLKLFNTYKIRCKICNHPLKIKSFATTSSIPQQIDTEKKRPYKNKKKIPSKSDFLNTNTEVNWRDSIQFKFSVNLCLVMVSILVVYMLINTITIKHRMTKDLNELAQRTVKRLSKSLVEPIWEIDEIQIQDTVLSEMMEENIYAIIVKDVDRKIILYGSTRGENWLIERTNTPIKGDFISYSSDIYKKDELSGVVEIYVTKRFITIEYFREIRNIMITTILLILAISITNILTMKRLLIQPILHLIEVAERLSFGDFSVKIESKSKDEIGNLSKALERMQVSLTYAIYRLRQR
jgi:methyl-accepting chemotaxis protein